METALQDDIHLAVFDDASCLLHYLLPGWVDDFGVHATYKGERLELGVQCERLILSIIYPSHHRLLTRQEVAMVYLVTLAVAGGVFMFCSFWIYHYVDLEHGSGDLTELETEALE